MASANRDKMLPGAGKLLKDDDSVFDQTMFLEGIEDGSTPASVVLTAGSAHVGTVGSPDDLIDVVLSLDTNAYAPGDCLAATQEIASAVRVAGGTAILKSILVVDEDDVGAALDVLILQTNVGIGTENAAADIGANAEKVLAAIEVAATDYVDLTSAQVASPELKQESLLEAAAASTSLFIAAIARGAATHTAAGITVRLGLLRN